MRKVRLAGAAAGVLTGIVLVAGTALGGSDVGSRTTRFTGTYAGRAVVSATGETTANITAKATGVGIPVGKSTWSGTGAGSSGDPCQTFTGSAVLVAKDKSKLKFSVLPTGKACPTAANEQISAVSGKATIKGGTKKYKKARGSFTFSGTYDRGKGTFTVKFTGSLTY